MSAKNEFLQSVKKIQVHVTEIYSRSIIVILMPLFKAKLTLEFYGIATTNYCKKKEKKTNFECNLFIYGLQREDRLYGMMCIQITI